MRIQHFVTSQRQSNVEVSAIPACYLVEDRFVSIVFDQELSIYDLHAPGEPVFRLEGVAAHVFRRALLVIFDGDHWFSCWQRTKTAWQCLSRFQIPPGYESELRFLQNMTLSDSGSFLLLGALGKTHQALLLEVKTGYIKASIPLTLSLRAGFGTLPDGKEILFLSATNYMGVQMRDCASGRLLHTFVPTSGWDFCHASYQLIKDATRLLTFGCIWAAPYEIRLYDPTAWTGDTQAGQANFPLPEVFRQEEVFWGADLVLPAAFLPAEDGILSCLSLVTFKDLPEPGSEDESDMLEGLSAQNREIVEVLYHLSSDWEMALLIRCVNPVTGVVARWSVQPILPTQPGHVHLLSNHRIVLVNEHIQVFDGVTGVLHDYGAFKAPAKYFSTMVTSDAQTVIVQYDQRYAYDGSGEE